MEGSYPEAGETLAVNGAEIDDRPAYPTGWDPARILWVVQNRAHAIHNTCYCLAPNLGAYHAAPWLVDPHYTAEPGDYTGRIMHECALPAMAMRRYHQYRGAEGVQDQFQVLQLHEGPRVEQYKLIYDALMAMGGILPKEPGDEEPPKRHGETDAIFAKVVDKLVEFLGHDRQGGEEEKR